MARKGATLAVNRAGGSRVAFSVWAPFPVPTPPRLRRRRNVKERPRDRDGRQTSRVAKAVVSRATCMRSSPPTAPTTTARTTTPGSPTVTPGTGTSPRRIRVALPPLRQFSRQHRRRPQSGFSRGQPGLFGRRHRERPHDRSAGEKAQLEQLEGTPRQPGLQGQHDRDLHRRQRLEVRPGHD